MFGYRHHQHGRTAGYRLGDAAFSSSIRGAFALLCAVGMIAACSENEDAANNAVAPNASPAGGSGVDPSTTPQAGAASPMPATGPTMTGMDASTGTPAPKPAAPVDAGTPSPSSDAGMTNAGAGGGAGTATAGSGGAGAGGAAASPPPVTLPDPNMPGPYEVAKLENVGVGFENPPTAANDKSDGAGCTSFIQSFGGTADAARDYALFGPNYKVELYTLYHPKNMVEGQLYPVLSWANGTCAKTNGYDALLTHVASHGFIVIATNSRYTGSGKFQLRGLDYIEAENAREGSPLYKHVDTAKVGLFGHSQGGGSTGAASGDPRVKSSVLMHGGGGSMLHAPGLFLTGDGDLNPSGVRSNYNAVNGPAAFGSLKMSDHITMMKEPMRMAPEVAAWFRYTLLDDAVAKKWYVGADCLLCTDSEWAFAQKNLK
jgi:hypothetical protein